VEKYCKLYGVNIAVWRNAPETFSGALYVTHGHPLCEGFVWAESETGEGLAISPKKLTCKREGFAPESLTLRRFGDKTIL
jgi:hypothetical protein